MAIPLNALVICPRCKTLRSFVNVSAGGIQYRCGGCEWTYTFTAVAPTGTATAAVVTPATTLAITVASGGASFTAGMYLLYDTGVNAEVVRVTTTGTATSIPVAAGFSKPHLTAVTFGQLLISSTFAGTGQEAVPSAPGWGF
jgi:hypothetical protein